MTERDDDANGLITASQYLVFEKKVGWLHVCFWFAAHADAKLRITASLILTIC
jgi:hypothetical protein